MSSCPSDESLQASRTVSMSARNLPRWRNTSKSAAGCQAPLERLARDGSQGETGALMRLAEPSQVPALPWIRGGSTSWAAAAWGSCIGPGSRLWRGMSRSSF